MPLSLNKQKEREWDNIIRQEAKVKGWHFRGWFAYKKLNDFFYKANFYTSAFNNSLYGSLQFKPLIIDDTFWQIVDLNGNKKMPLSFRGNGAFVVGSKDIYDYKLNIEPETLKVNISNLLDTINEKVALISSNITNLDTFIQYIEEHPNARDGSQWFDSDLLIVTSIVQQNYEKALSLLYYAKKTRGMCSWGFGDKDFYDLAVEYCLKHK